MSRFGLLISVPHSGTHRLMAFMGALHTQVERVSIGETGNAILEAYLNSQISAEKFVRIIKWLRIKYPNPPYIQRDLAEALFNEGELIELSDAYDKKYKWIFLYSHLVEPNYMNHKWPQDLLDSGNLLPQTIACLRDPILTSISIMLLTGDYDTNYNNFKAPNFKGTSPYIWWTVNQFKKLVEYKHLLGDKMQFLPVDLYNNLLWEDRVIRATKLIAKFDLHPTDPWEDSVRAWRRFNPSKHNPEEIFKDHAVLGRYLHMKTELEAGHHLPYSTDLIDYLIDIYKNVPGLQLLFEAEGYSDLSWFA